MNWIVKKMVDMTSGETPKMLTGQGGWAVCNLIINPGKVFTGYN